MHSNSSDDNNEQWDALLNIANLSSEIILKDRKRQSKTKGKLRLRHPDESKIKKRKGVTNYSARTLGYMMHMLAIMIGPLK
jgi:hypothetical protein